MRMLVASLAQAISYAPGTCACRHFAGEGPLCSAGTMRRHHMQAPYAGTMQARKHSECSHHMRAPYAGTICRHHAGKEAQ